MKVKSELKDPEKCIDDYDRERGNYKIIRNIDRGERKEVSCQKIKYKKWQEYRTMHIKSKNW